MSTSGEIGLRMHSREIPDAARRAREGDRAAFSRCIDDCAPRLWRMASRLAASHADAEDLLQETFLRAWRGIRRFRGDSELSTWLTRILLNAAHDRRRRRRPLPIRAAGSDRERSDPAEGLARRELLSRVLDAMDALPKRQGECLLLRSRAGLPIREIADVMKIKPAAVKSHLVQARRKLVRRFGREAEEWGLTTRE